MLYLSQALGTNIIFNFLVNELLIWIEENKGKKNTKVQLMYQKSWGHFCLNWVNWGYAVGEYRPIKDK